jgi:hypothetical protein
VHQASLTQRIPGTYVHWSQNPSAWFSTIWYPSVSIFLDRRIGEGVQAEVHLAAIPKPSTGSGQIIAPHNI